MGEFGPDVAHIQEIVAGLVGGEAQVLELHRDLLHRIGDTEKGEGFVCDWLHDGCRFDRAENDPRPEALPRGPRGGWDQNWVLPGDTGKMRSFSDPAASGIGLPDRLPIGMGRNISWAPGIPGGPGCTDPPRRPTPAPPRRGPDPTTDCCSSSSFRLRSFS